MEQNERKFKIELTEEELHLIDRALMAFGEEIGSGDLRYIALVERMLKSHTPYFGGADAMKERIDEGWKAFFEKTDPIEKLQDKIYRIRMTEVDEP